MATTCQVGTNEKVPMAKRVTSVQVISVQWDKANNGVKVTPNLVNKGTTVRFKNPKGGKLKITFLYPSRQPIETVLPTEKPTPTVGDAYHFKYVFTLPSTKDKVTPGYGGGA